MDLNKKLEELKPYQLNCNVFDVYSYNGLTMQDLLCQFFTKINECITVSNETIDLAKWLVNEGLEIEVVKKLMIWLEDGTLENIINVNLFNTLNEKISGFSSQLEQNVNYINDIGVNIKSLGAKGDGLTDDTNAILKASKLGCKIFFPKGEYVLNTNKIDLSQGCLFEGVTQNDSVIIYAEGSSDYLFNINLYSGFKNIGIKFNNNFLGCAINLEPGRISFENNSYHYPDSYLLENIKISFKYQSGYGTGLKIDLKNYDSNGNVYCSNVRNYLSYLNVNFFNVLDGEKCIEIKLNQKDTVSNKVWFTSSMFNKIYSNRCVYGLYLSANNKSSVGFDTIDNILFSNFQIQTSNSNFFENTDNQTTPIYLKNNSSSKIKISFNNLTIWDSESGESGYLKNVDININGVYFGYSLKRELGYSYGFENINSNINILDSSMQSKFDDKGIETTVFDLNGGTSIRPNTNTTNKTYKAGIDVYTNMVDSQNADFNLELYDINRNKNAELNLCRNNFNLTIKDTSGVMRNLLKFGTSNVYNSHSASEQGFYISNGMYFKYEISDVEVPVNNTYQIIDIPIKETFESYPILINANCIYRDSESLNYDVYINGAYVYSDRQTVRVIVKHNKTSDSLILKFGISLIGVKQ